MSYPDDRYMWQTKGKAARLAYNHAPGKTYSIAVNDSNPLYTIDASNKPLWASNYRYSGGTVPGTNVSGQTSFPINGYPMEHEFLGKSEGAPFSGNVIGMVDHIATNSNLISGEHPELMPPGSKILMGTPIPANSRIIATQFAGNGMGSDTGSGGTAVMKLYDSGDGTTYTATATVSTDSATPVGGLIRSNASAFWGGSYVSKGEMLVFIEIGTSAWNVLAGSDVGYLSTFVHYINV